MPNEELGRRAFLERELERVIAKRRELKALPFPEDEEAQDELARQLEDLDVQEGNLTGEIAEIDYLNGEA